MSRRRARTAQTAPTPPPAQPHRLPSDLLTRRVCVHLVGVGGNGAQMAACLARLDVAMRALGHPYGLHVTAFDGDRVSEANVGRQLYSPSDIGRHKALVTIHRINQFYGLDWDARPVRYEAAMDASRFLPRVDLLVSCVDTRAARRALHALAFHPGADYRYWLDLGNTEASAQVVLGEAKGRRRTAADRLPCVTELFPDLLDDRIADDDRPSCSVRMSLAAQGLFVNDIAVRFAMQLLYELFSRGQLTQHGVIVNLDAKRAGPIDIDPAAWARFGYPSKAAPGTM